MTDDATRQMDDTQAVETPPPVAPAAPAADTTAAVPTTNAGAHAAPVAAVPMAASAGPSRVRWLVALGVTALAAIIAVGAFVVLSSQPTPEALKYVPGDAIVVVELRPELPGDQMQNLGNLLQHFPGFRDQSTLTQKLDQAFTQLLSRAGDNRFDYMTDIKPWLNGPAFLAVRRPTGQSAEGSSAPPGFLVSATTNGQVSCASTFEGSPTTSETYNGVELILMAGSEYGCVVQGKQGLLGDRLMLRAALDAKSAGNGMDKSSQYADARKAVVGDHLATAYIDTAAIGSLMNNVTGGLPSGQNPLASLSFGQLPPWLMESFRAEGDQFIVESVAPIPPAPAGGPSLLPVPAAHASGIVGMVPADAVAYVEAQGAGASLINAIRELRTIPEVNQSFQMLDGMVAMDDLLGWIDDVGVVVTGGDKPAGGVILLAKDEAAAKEKATSLGTLVGLAALSGQGIAVTETTVNNVEITTLTITDTSALFPPGSLPFDPSTLGPIELSYAVKGRAFIFGTGEAFISSLANVSAGNSLADSAAYKRVSARGVTPSNLVVYVSSPKVIELVESFVPASELTMWNTELKPYVEPFEAVYVSSSLASGMNRAVYIISVKQ